MSSTEAYEIALAIQEAKALETVRRTEILIDDEKESILLSTMFMVADRE